MFQRVALWRKSNCCIAVCNFSIPRYIRVRSHKFNHTPPFYTCECIFIYFMYATACLHLPLSIMNAMNSLKIRIGSSHCPRGHRNHAAGSSLPIPDHARSAVVNDTTRTPGSGYRCSNTEHPSNSQQPPPERICRCTTCEEPELSA